MADLNNVRNRKTPPKIGEKKVEGWVIGKGKVIIPPEEVYKLAAIGATDADIARFYNTTDLSISRNFAREIVAGREEIKNRLRKAMIENACVRMNPAVQIFLAKNMLGMSDNRFNTDDDKPLPWNDEF